jgi:hypothetical protein
MRKFPDNENVLSKGEEDVINHGYNLDVRILSC